MKWRQVNDWHWARECGRYTVSRSLSFAKAKEGHWVYFAWFKPSKQGDMPISLSEEARDSLQAAIADCTAHIRENKPRHATAA